MTFLCKHKFTRMIGNESCDCLLSYLPFVCYVVTEILTYTIIHVYVHVYCLWYLLHAGSAWNLHSIMVKSNSFVSGICTIIHTKGVDSHYFCLHHVATRNPSKHMLQCKNRYPCACIVLCCTTLQHASKVFNMHFRSQCNTRKIL